jgi:hypothetical protein
MYLDKHDGRIDNEFFDSKSASSAPSGPGRAQYCGSPHREPELRRRRYPVLELVHRVHELFEIQPPNKNGNCWMSWFRELPLEGRNLEAEFRKPFNLIAVLPLLTGGLAPCWLRTRQF